MKDLYSLIVLIILIMVGCKTQKIAPKPQPVAQETVAPSTPAPPPPSTTKTIPSTTENAIKAAPISSKEERFSAATGETADYGSNRFFVILGSFSVLENAQRLKATLTTEGFQPIIVQNEGGMYRVCGNGFAQEGEARARITEVRMKFPKYSDIWLLIKKQ
jgi:cell division protein FtsN